MNNIEYLISSLPEDGCNYLKKLRGILTSSNIKEGEGNPRKLKVDFVHCLYARRREALLTTNVEPFGVNEIVDKLTILPGDAEVLIYSLKNDFYSGECFLKDNAFIGCAFIRRGLSFSIECLTSDE